MPGNIFKGALAIYIDIGRVIRTNYYFLLNFHNKTPGWNLCMYVGRWTGGGS